MTPDITSFFGLYKGVAGIFANLGLIIVIAVSIAVMMRVLGVARPVLIGLIVGNFLMAAAFLLLMTGDYATREAWGRANARYELAINGLPVDKEERDEQGRLKYLLLSDELLKELTGNPDIATQLDALDARQKEILDRINDAKIKSNLPGLDPRRAAEKVPKYVEAMLPLARTVREREELLNQIGSRDINKLGERFEAQFAEVKNLKDRDARRREIARLFVAMTDVLPTETEKQQKVDDVTATTDFKRMLAVVGARSAAQAIDEDARTFERMATQVRNARDEARSRFANGHDHAIRVAEERDHELAQVEDQREDKRLAAMRAEKGAADQKKLYEKRAEELKEMQNATAKILDRLAKMQDDLFAVRVSLRDANRINQEKEQKIRYLEREVLKREASNP